MSLVRNLMGQLEKDKPKVKYPLAIPGMVSLAQLPLNPTASVADKVARGLLLSTAGAL
jgi:hypothetical protein